MLAQLGAGWNEWGDEIKRQRGVEAEQERAAGVMIRSMKRMLLAQLGAGWKTWVENFNMGKHQSHAAMVMIKSINRMLLAQLGAGWVAWRDIIKEWKHEAELQAIGMARMVRAVKRMMRAQIAGGWNAWRNWITVVLRREEAKLMEIKAQLHLDEISATLLSTRGRMFDKANAILKTWYVAVQNRLLAMGFTTWAADYRAYQAEQRRERKLRERQLLKNATIEGTCACMVCARVRVRARESSFTRSFIRADRLTPSHSLNTLGIEKQLMNLKLIIFCAWTDYVQKSQHGRGRADRFGRRLARQNFLKTAVRILHRWHRFAREEVGSDRTSDTVVGTIEHA